MSHMDYLHSVRVERSCKRSVELAKRYFQSVYEYSKELGIQYSMFARARLLLLQAAGFCANPIRASDLRFRWRPLDAMFILDQSSKESYDTFHDCSMAWTRLRDLLFSRSGNCVFAEDDLKEIAEDLSAIKNNNNPVTPEEWALWKSDWNTALKEDDALIKDLRQHMHDFSSLVQHIPSEIRCDLLKRMWSYEVYNGVDIEIYVYQHKDRINRELETVIYRIWYIVRDVRGNQLLSKSQWRRALELAPYLYEDFELLY